MPVPTHFKFTVRGRFLGTPETWSTGAHFTRNQGASADAGLDDVNEGNITTAVGTFFGSSMFNNKIQVDDWRMYVIGTNGRMEGNGPKIHEFAPGAVKGTATDVLYPPQVALCCTLVADNRGPAERGRMYLPAPNSNLDGTWLLNDTALGNVGSALTSFLKQVSDAIDLDLLNSSKGCNVSPGPPGSANGTLQEIDHIEIGHALDTVRNRRKSMVENRLVFGQIDW